MKITTSATQSNSSVAILAFDVSKNTLNMTTAIGGQRSDHEFQNRTPQIEEQLLVWKQQALMAGYSDVQVSANRRAVIT